MERGRSGDRRFTLGILAGAALGIVAGLLESSLAPLTTPWRFCYAVGADGLLGAVWGCVATLLVMPFLVVRPGRPRSHAGLLALLAFPALAIALGWVANRILLSGIHFLSPLSLVVDAAALVASGILAFFLGRAASSVAERTRFLDRGPLLPVILLAVLALGVALPTRFLARGEPDAARPDIVLVSIDTLRSDRLSICGEPTGTSPMLDRLCRQGLLFEQALTVSPGSAAAHAALLTSRYPVSNGVYSNFAVLDESVETFAEFLRARGYRTGGFVTNTFLGKRFQFDQGFDAYVESGFTERLEEPSGPVLFRSLAVVQMLGQLRARFDVSYDPSFETALRWLDESDRPTFFFVHFMDVHSPYAPPPPYGDVFGASPDGDPIVDEHRNRFGWRPSVEAYLAEIRHTDAKIERLVRALRERGRFDDTVLVLTSDHGENLADHEPYFTHGSTLFDATVRILTAIRAPELPRRGIEPVPVENVDVLPTLTALLGWETPDEWEGQDLVGPISEHVRYSQIYRDFCARTRAWKVILHEDGDRVWYDLERDPGETRVQPSDPQRFELAGIALQAWLDAHTTELYRQGARTVSPEELSPETIEKLKTLGYL